MAFIVEMMWGRPPQIVVYGLDEDGELFPEKVIPCEGEPDPEWRFFSCHGGVWKHFLDLGVRYGWKPMGTVPAAGSEWENLDGSRMTMNRKCGDIPVPEGPFEALTMRESFSHLFHLFIIFSNYFLPFLH